MKAHAFSIIELLVCVAIVAVVAAIMTPVFASARHSGQVTASLGNLHQMHLGLKLYQADENGEGKYGSLEEMGLPNGLFVIRNRFGTPLSIWRSPCGQNPSWQPVPIVIQYDYRPEANLEDFASVAPTYRESLVMFSDMNCADHGEPLRSDYIPHLGLGVFLSGTLVKPRKTGDDRHQSWWSTPQP